MLPTFVIAGRIAREYIFPPLGPPVLDAPGGSLLYAAGGMKVWDPSMGLLARVGEDFPREWIRGLEQRGLDVRGIRIQPQAIDLRSFIAYTATNERSQSSIVSHFARREMTFPKSLLGYQPPDESKMDTREPDFRSPSALDVPREYRDVSHVHICPLDFTSQSQLINLFKGGPEQVVSLDPSAGYMNPTFWRDLRIVLQGVTVFHPSEEELRALFWGETNDLWEMAAGICDYGPRLVVIKRGGHGQIIYDAADKCRYEIPAYSSRLADPTGVGDAFCGGFLAGFQKTRDPLMAAVYGGVSASLKIEGSGPFYPLDVLPGLADARLHSLQQLVRRI